MYEYPPSPNVKLMTPLEIKANLYHAKLYHAKALSCKKLSKEKKTFLVKVTVKERSIKGYIFT